MCVSCLYEYALDWRLIGPTIMIMTRSDVRWAVLWAGVDALEQPPGCRVLHSVTVHVDIAHRGGLTESQTDVTRH